MSTAHHAQARQIVDQIRHWPDEARRELVQDMISTFSQPENGRRDKSLKSLVGLMNTNGPSPGHAECRATLEEELIRKHVR